MSNLATLKKKAAEFEQKRQFDRALEAYEEVLRLQDGTEDADVALYNRVGDMQLRLGRTQEALRSYERAVDLYSDRGFLNNAIALCNKILRQDPLRAPVHYKLGRASTIKGFRSDARRHLVEYVALMERAGRVDEALAALTELVELASDADDLRLLLAEQHERHGHVADAIAQLERAADTAERAGRSSDAAATRDRIRALDPDYAVGEHGSATAEFGIDLAAPASGRMPELVLIEPTAFDPGQVRPSPTAGTPAHAPESALDIVHGATDADATDAPTGDGYVMPDLEPTAFEGGYDAPPLEGVVLDDRLGTGAEIPLIDAGDLPRASGDFTLRMSGAAELVDDEDVEPVELTFIDVDAPITDAADVEFVDHAAIDDAPADLPPADAALDLDPELDPAIAREPLRGVRPVQPVAPAHRSMLPTPNAVRPVPSTPISSRPVVAADAPASSGFVDLGELLRDDVGPRSTRMVTEERAPSGDEQADFAVMLRKFKQGVSEHVDDEDYDSHYDLGVAYKEMGLVDEAIAAFQRALRGTTRRPRTYEALGQCFLERGQHSVAMAVLQRAVEEGGLGDEQLVGVYYLLGRTAEAMNQRDDAVRYYERVLAVDITFSDVADRMGLVSQVPR
jgi:tetratricopeptide (TPR) repeat protein